MPETPAVYMRKDGANHSYAQAGDNNIASALQLEEADGFDEELYPKTRGILLEFF